MKFDVLHGNFFNVWISGRDDADFLFWSYCCELLADARSSEKNVDEKASMLQTEPLHYSNDNSFKKSLIIKSYFENDC